MLLEQTTYKYRKWSFDVAEYYPDIGVCSPDSLRAFKNEINSANGKFSFETTLTDWPCLGKRYLKSQFLSGFLEVGVT